MPPVKKTTTTTTTTTSTTVAARTERTGTHYRFNAWVALTILSLVAVVAIVDISKKKQQKNFQERWSLAMACTSMSAGFLACVGHAIPSLRDRFVSSIFEILLAIIAVGVWIFGLPMISTPYDGLAVNQNFAIDNANLYFAAWGAFIFAMLLLASVGNERGVSGTRDSFARRWLWLIVSSMVVMVGSSRMFDSVCQNNRFEGEFCSELKLGIALGVISAVIAGIMTLLLWFSPPIIPLDTVGFFFCLCMMAIWATLVAFMTFDDGPGSTVGNLFFGVWISAILSLDLGVCYAMAFM